MRDVILLSAILDLAAKMRKPFSKYGVVSLLSFLYIIGCTALLVEVFDAHESMGYGVALVTVLLVNFLLMRFWVYGESRNQMEWKRQLVTLLGVSSGIRFLEWLIYTGLVLYTPMYYLLTVIIVQGSSFFLKFFVYHFFVFGDGKK